MCGFYGITFIEYILVGKTLLDYINPLFLMIIKRTTRWYIGTLKTNMVSVNFNLKKIDETRNYILEEIKHNDLMSRKRKIMCRALNYFEYFLVFISVVSGVAVGFASSVEGFNICAVTAGIKTYEPIINKRRKRMIK